MRRNALVLVVVAVLTVIGFTGSASASDVCVGRQGTVGACVGNATYYLGCYYLGGSSCTHVYADAPRVTACWLGNPSLIECA